MYIGDILESLNQQHQRLIERYKGEQSLLLEDIPTIESAPIISKEQRQRIYEQQEGFVFKGINSSDLGKILRGYYLALESV